MKLCGFCLFVVAGLLFGVAGFGAEHYVSGTGSQVVPYSNWADAAHFIQDAIDVSVAGDTIYVTNGVYNTGGVALVGIMTNRVAVTSAVSVISANGPEVTIIEGQGPMGTNAMRGVYLAAGAFLSGFTVRNGHTMNFGDSYTEQGGGGVWCDGGATISNCVIVKNNASVLGGGGYSGAIVHSVIMSNTAPNGGGWFALDAEDCELSENRAYYGGGTYGGGGSKCVFRENVSVGSNGGGGSYNGYFSQSIFIGNRADLDGAAVYSGQLINCLVKDNQASRAGGGAYLGQLINCTIVGNQAYYGGGISSYGSPGTPIVTNCIIYYNTATVSNNYYGGIFGYCCSVPTPAGIGNISATPWFVDYMQDNVQLSRISDCIDAGSNIALAVDLEDTFRPLDGRTNGVAIIDIGCYEFDPATADSDADGLTDVDEQDVYGTDPLQADSDSDGLSDGVEVLDLFSNPNSDDSDGDHFLDHQEWISGTELTNAASLFGVSGTAVVDGDKVVVTWPGCTNAQYDVECCTNLSEAVWSSASNRQNLVGAAGMMSYTNTNVSFSCAYRVAFRTQTKRVRVETSMGNFLLELYPELAPETVSNFMRYVVDAHFDDTIFHRVITNSFSMIQGGHFQTNLVGKTTRATIRNEAFNGLLNNRATIAMARTSDPHSATDQFFINVGINTWNYRGEPNPYWGYAVFGTVVSGMDVVDAISAVPTESRDGFNDIPVVDVVIEHVVAE